MASAAPAGEKPRTHALSSTSPSGNLRRRKRPSSSRSLPLLNTTTKVRTYLQSLHPSSYTLRDEAVSVFLWTSSVLCLLWVTEIMHWTAHIFLLLLSLFMLLWDVVGLSRLKSQLNPAVTLALGFAQKGGFRDCLFRSTVQLVVTVGTVFVFSHDSVLLSLPPMPTPHPDAHWLHAMLFEALATSVMALTALSLPHLINTRSYKLTTWLVSSALASAAVLLAQDWSGACMNPAFAFALALVHDHDDWGIHVVYWVGPLVGAAVAAIVHVRVVTPLFPVEKVVVGVESKRRDLTEDNQDSLDKKEI